MNDSFSSLEYGGLIKLDLPHGINNPSKVGFKGHGSKSKWNSSFNVLYKSEGVFQLSCIGLRSFISTSPPLVYQTKNTSL